MTKEEHHHSQGGARKILGIVFWPFIYVWRGFHKHFLSYLFSSSLHDADRIYSIKFIWYGDAVYLHPLTWGSAILYLIARQGWQPGWLLLIWFITLGVSFLAVMYNFDVIRMSMLGVGLVAVFGLAFMSTVKLQWNPVESLGQHLKNLDAAVSPGFYLVACYLFLVLIVAEIVWAWLFHRVEIDESYVYEHGFLQGTTREPIFARGLKRHTKDLLELLLLGAGDIQHRTRNGVKRFKNVPFASLWLGTSIDSLLDYRRRGQVILERKQQHDEAEDARISDAHPDELDDGGFDDHDHDQDHDHDHEDQAGDDDF